MSKKLRSKLRQGAIVRVGWLTSNSPLVAEAMASCGFDALVVDMEHGPIDEMGATAIFASVERRGCLPIVRLPSSDPYLARRLLDSGVQGLMVPCVEDIAIFDKFVGHCFYPPRGCRGTGLGRGNLWGEEFETHYEDFEPLIIPMIETRRGVAAAEAIASHIAVDALFIGPYDLSADLGEPGNFSTEVFESALAVTMNACSAAGKAPGIHQIEPDFEALRARQDEGYRFIAFGTDIIAMRQAFKGLTGL